MPGSPESSPTEGALHAYTGPEGEFKVSPPSQVQRDFEKFSEQRGGAPPPPEPSLTDVGGVRHWIYASETQEKEIKPGPIIGKDRQVFDRAGQIYSDSQEAHLTAAQNRLLERLVLRAEVPGQNLIVYLRGYLQNHRDELRKRQEEDWAQTAEVLAVSGLAELASAATAPQTAETVKGLAVLKGLPQDCDIIPSANLLGSKPGGARQVLERLTPYNLALAKLSKPQEAQDIWITNDPKERLRPFIFNQAERRYQANPQVVDANHHLVRQLTEALNTTVLPDGLLYRRVEDTLPLVDLPREAWRASAQVSREGKRPVPVARLAAQEQPYPFEYDEARQTFQAIPRLVDPAHPAVIKSLDELHQDLKGPEGEVLLRVHRQAQKMDQNRWDVPNLLFLGAVEVKAWTTYEAQEFAHQISLKPQEPLEADVGVKLALNLWAERQFVLEFLPLDRQNVPQVLENGQTRPEPVLILRFLADVPNATIEKIYQETIKRGLSDVVVQRLPYTQTMLSSLAQAALEKIDVAKIASVSQRTDS